MTLKKWPLDMQNYKHTKDPKRKYMMCKSLTWVKIIHIGCLRINPILHVERYYNDSVINHYIPRKLIHKKCNSKYLDAHTHNPIED